MRRASRGRRERPSSALDVAGASMTADVGFAASAVWGDAMVFDSRRESFGVRGVGCCADTEVLLELFMLKRIGFSN